MTYYKICWIYQDKMFCSGHKPDLKTSTERTMSQSSQRNRKITRNHGNRNSCSLAWLPVCTSLSGIITILVTYTFAVTTDHIFPLLPYISDTGIEYPESSIFSLCLDIVAFLLVLTTYVRYKLIGQFVQKLPAEPRYQRIGRINGASLLTSVVAAAGLMVLANFPEDENLMVHLMGAFFCFAFGVAYCLQHTWLSFKTCPDFSPPWMCFLRLCLTTSAAVMLTLVIVYGTVLRWESDECNPQMNYRKTSALFEWLLVVTFITYFLTYGLEFHKVQMTTVVRMRTLSSSSISSATSTSSSEKTEKKEIDNQQQTKEENSRKETCYHGNGIIHALANEHNCSKDASPV